MRKQFFHVSRNGGMQQHYFYLLRRPLHRANLHHSSLDINLHIFPFPQTIVFIFTMMPEKYEATGQKHVPTKRELAIATGSLKRCYKELTSYVEELKENEATTAKVRASDDHSKLKQWETVCIETQAQIPQAITRVQTAVKEIENMYVPQLEDTEELTAAREEVVIATGILKQHGVE